MEDKETLFLSRVAPNPRGGARLHRDAGAKHSPVVPIAGRVEGAHREYWSSGLTEIPKTPTSRLLPMGHLRNPSAKRKRASANAAARRATPGIVSSCLIPQKPYRLSLQFAVAAVRYFIMLNPFIPISRLSCRKLSLRSLTTYFTKAAAAAAAEAYRPNWTHHTGRDMVQG